MEATLTDVLTFREKKAELQRQLLERNRQGILVSLGMNIPGPVKKSPSILRAFAAGQEVLEALLRENGVILAHGVLKERAGCAGIYLLESSRSALAIKKQTVALEEQHTLGRLFDLDVFDEKAQPLTREQVGAEKRRCLLCGGEAKACGRSRRHSVRELQRKVQEIIGAWTAEEIGNLAERALLEELYTTPKPGLVDLYSCGAHRDMNVPLFEKSARALNPWFARMAEQGYLQEDTPEELFVSIRKTGMLAERDMFQATEGVNTHKGLIFTLGIFCAAAGRCLGREEPLTLEHLIQMEQEMTGRILEQELLAAAKKEAQSNGEQNLQRYGTSGVRGEALRGYPSLVEQALPVIESGLKAGKAWEQVKLQTLFTLMQCVEDSNVLYRQNPETLAWMHREAEAFLKAGGAYVEGAEAVLREMDRHYIERNISPGGCADLLAAAIFLQLLITWREEVAL